MNSAIRITELSAEILRLTGHAGPGYRALYHAAIDARIPAERVGRCWIVRRGDIPAVIAALGLAAGS